jgi:hypothetical protein
LFVLYAFVVSFTNVVVEDLIIAKGMILVLLVLMEIDHQVLASTIAQMQFRDQVGQLHNFSQVNLDMVKVMLNLEFQMRFQLWVMEELWLKLQLWDTVLQWYNQVMDNQLQWHSQVTDNQPALLNLQPTIHMPNQECQLCNNQ